MATEPDTNELKCNNMRYPIMLVHGTSVTDRKTTRCWGRIPDALKAAGAEVYFGRQDAWGGLETNTLQLAESINIALRQSGAAKINLIAHSKGGLECRALTNMNGYPQKIASITTISTPHDGVSFLSAQRPAFFWMIAVGSVFLYLPFRLLLGDKQPNAYKVLRCMTQTYCRTFNEQTPDLPDIYYQSYAGKLRPANKNTLFAFFRRAENRFDENDGLIGVNSAKWGDFHGSISGEGRRGISHADEVDFFKRDYEGEAAISNQNQTYTCVPDIYVRIVKDLAERGY